MAANYKTTIQTIKKIKTTQWKAEQINKSEKYENKPKSIQKSSSENTKMQQQNQKCEWIRKLGGRKLQEQNQKNTNICIKYIGVLW